MREVMLVQTSFEKLVVQLLYEEDLLEPVRDGGDVERREEGAVPRDERNLARGEWQSGARRRRTWR